MYYLSFNGFNVSMLLSNVIGITFALLLILSKRKNQRANRFLGFMILIMTAWIFWVASLDIGLDRYFASINVIPFTFSLALGPCIYFYVKYLCWPTNKGCKHDIWHFSPVLLEILAHIFKVLESQSKGISPEETDIFIIIYPLIQLASLASVAIYFSFSLKQLKQFHLFLKENFSDYYQYQLHWLKRLLIIFVVLEFSWLPYTLVDYFVFDFNLAIADYYPLYLLISVITVWLGIESFLRPELVVLDRQLEQKPQADVAATEDDIATGRWLEQEIKANRYYLNSDLTLKILAEHLNMHPNNLSRVLNKGLNKCFADVINAYRVQAVVAKFSESRHDSFTLLDIALESGFNSKTTFNRIFKKFTGKTPLEFKKQQISG